MEKTLILGKVEGGRRRGQQRVSWLDGITASLDLNLSKFQDLVKDKGDLCAAVRGVTKGWTHFSDRTVITKLREHFPSTSSF